MIVSPLVSGICSTGGQCTEGHTDGTNIKCIIAKALTEIPIGNGKPASRQ